MGLQVEIAIVHLEEDRLLSDRDRTKIVLLVGIVAFVEGDESGIKLSDLRVAEGADAVGEDETLLSITSSVPIRPPASSTMDQRRPAISQARSPARTERHTSATFRSGNLPRRAWSSMRRNWARSITFACRPGMANLSMLMIGRTQPGSSERDAMLRTSA
nr:hypothetical protein [Enterovirga rhinocerotis]